jgi:hypothetical protein
MRFTGSNASFVDDGQGGRFLEGTFELTILEGTGIYKPFVGGHNHMVDKLHVAPVDSDQSYRVTRTSARVFSAEKRAITSNAMSRASVGSRASGTSNVNRRGRPEKRVRH